MADLNPPLDLIGGSAPRAARAPHDDDAMATRALAVDAGSIRAPRLASTDSRSTPLTDTEVKPPD